MRKLKKHLQNFLFNYKINIYYKDVIFVFILALIMFFVVLGSVKQEVQKDIEQNQQEVKVEEVEEEVKQEETKEDATPLQKPPESLIKDSEVTNNDNQESEVEEDGFYYYSDIPLKKETQEYIWKTSEDYGVSYEMMLSIAKIESNFRPKIVTSEGSYGMYQLHSPSGTLDWLATTTEAEFDNIDSFKWDNPKHNASAATWYIKYLSGQWEGYSEEEKLALVLGSFNMGYSGFKNYIQSHDPYEWHYVKKVLAYKVKLEKERYQ